IQKNQVKSIAHDHVHTFIEGICESEIESVIPHPARQYPFKPSMHFRIIIYRKHSPLGSNHHLDPFSQDNSEDRPSGFPRIHQLHSTIVIVMHNLSDQTKPETV